MAVPHVNHDDCVANPVNQADEAVAGPAVNQADDAMADRAVNQADDAVADPAANQAEDGVAIYFPRKVHSLLEWQR